LTGEVSFEGLSLFSKLVFAKIIRRFSGLPAVRPAAAAVLMISDDTTAL